MNQQMIRRLSTPITLIVLLGLLTAGLAWGYKTVTAKVTGAPPPPCVTVPLTVLTPGSVTVNVYNAGTLSGLATRVADKLQKGGFLIGKVKNSTDKVVTIVIVGAAAGNPEVQLVAGWFVDPQIQADGRPDHTVDVIVGDGYSESAGMVAEPPTSLEIPSGAVCLPASKTPTPTPDPGASDQPADQPTDQPT